MRHRDVVRGLYIHQQLLTKLVASKTIDANYAKFTSQDTKTKSRIVFVVADNNRQRIIIAGALVLVDFIN